jgi:FkbM family methyltransferase
MGLINTLRFILDHPLNNGKRFHALRRFAAWQIGSRLVPGPVVVDFAGGTHLLVAPGQTGATGNIYAGLHEFAEMGFVLHLLRPDDLFVDVGANIGSYTILAGGAVGARCVAFEPDETTFASLRANVRLNDIADRVETIRSAVGATEGEVTFTVGRDTVNHVTVNGDASDVVTVPITTLDKALGGRTPLLMKIDVEGFEARVLEGALATLMNPSLISVIMETNGSGSRYDSDDRNLHQTMIDSGFVACSYDPFSRRLESAGERNDQGNTIYVRNIDLARDRITTAGKFAVARARVI